MVHLSIDTSTTLWVLKVAINDAVSISYSSEEHEAVDKGVIAVGATTMTETTVTMEADVAQISYNIGGATVGLFTLIQIILTSLKGKQLELHIASISMEF